MTHDKPYIIGIDLGTTNSALSYADLREKTPQIRIFAIPQLTGAGEISALPVLPSFLYIPGKYETALPENFVGILARDYGAKIPSRLVSSAKSWLCHSNVDRHAKILPYGAGDEVFKVSPVQASAEYLKHLRMAWNTAQGDDEDLWLEHQTIIITVPASFDEVARDLTIEAANLAGLKRVTLIEEPLAAFYNWLIRHENCWGDFVKPGELILVCDVGGGTTDFTLISLRESDTGGPRFERIAVGEHLILGGDNMDLALARQVEIRFSDKKSSLSADRWKSLCHQCRQAKELLLSQQIKSKKITLMGEGAKLIAKTLSATLTGKEAEKVIVEGFFPMVEPESAKIAPNRKGITEFGLPYQHEPAITRHLGQFLARHHAKPDLILFNGGALKPLVIQERIRAAIRYWFKENDERIPRVLENPDPDLAVALGASYYGLVKTGRGVKVGSGSARSFYLGIEARGQKAALCLIERGLDEGSHIELADKQFEVIANQPVSFDVYSSSFRSGDRCGDLIDIDDSLTALPPIRTMVQFGKKGTQTRIPAQIEAEYSEVGTLALWCKSGISEHRWRLQFQLRGNDGAAAVPAQDMIEDSMAKAACLKVRLMFSDAGMNCSDTLVKEIAALAEMPKEKWSLGFIRSLSDELIAAIDARKMKPDMESLWLNLSGFCLRPGFGDGFDEHRLKSAWKIYKPGPVYANNARVRSEWWIFWRRVAGGLNSGQQRQFIQDLSSAIISGKGKIAPQERIEIWMAVANMERLLAKDKVIWGRKLLSEISPKKCRPQQFWALSRIGARELLYGSADRVIPPHEAASWIEAILSQDWHEIKPVGAALSLMGRKTGDRMRDIEDALRERIIIWLEQHDLNSHVRFLKEAVSMEMPEQNAMFGESLPSGIVLKD